MNNLRNLVYQAECAMRARDDVAVELLLDRIAERQETLAKLAKSRAKRQLDLDRRIKRLRHWSEPH